MDLQTCTQCRESKPLEQFNRSKQRSNRRKPYCKACASRANKQRYSTMHAILREQQKAYRAAHLEEVRERNRMYEATHREDANRRNKAYEERHKERLRAKRAQWRETNREKLRADSGAYAAARKDISREKLQQWRQANPEKHGEQSRRRRAVKKGAPIIEKIDRAIVFERDKGLCQLCFRKLSKYQATLDHVIPLSHGGEHSYRNVVLACRSCNSRKGNRGWPQQQRLF